MPAYLENLDPDILERARQIKLVVFDVDGVLSDGRLYYTEAGKELKAFHARDGLGMTRLKQYGLIIGIITGRNNPVVAQRMQDLGIEHLYQGRHDKSTALRQLTEALSLSNAQVCYTGDDLLDLGVMEKVGLSVTVPDAHPWVSSAAHYTTSCPAGLGAAREVCDLLMLAQGLKEQELAFWRNQ